MQRTGRLAHGVRVPGMNRSGFSTLISLLSFGRSASLASGQRQPVPSSHGWATSFGFAQLGLRSIQAGLFSLLVLLSPFADSSAVCQEQAWEFSTCQVDVVVLATPGSGLSEHSAASIRRIVSSLGCCSSFHGMTVTEGEMGITLCILSK